MHKIDTNIPQEDKQKLKKYRKNYCNTKTKQFDENYIF